MACKTSYELHHHFPKLAEESGFTFNTHRPRVHIDWNKIRLIDIESLIRERRFVLVEQHLNDILDCVLESEFDVRILDDGVLKMFRLAQLAVEYQQFCRHYLDRSVYVLRQEITSLAQELDTTKRNLHEREEELRRVRKRTRHAYKTPLPYGNDNIATMILKTLSNRGDIFPNTSDGDIHQYNKCNHCEKVFLNQLYLKSHISRRHANVAEIPQKENQDNDQNNENTKLSSEIMELRNKLKEMEATIAMSHNQDVPTVTKEVKTDTTKRDNVYHNSKTDMKDAEVSTNSEDYLLNKLEEWKKEEHEKYNKEINILRTQIMETINSIKDKETEQTVQKDTKIIEQLQTTIVQQGAEILSLKQALNISKTKTDNENAERSKEAEAQILFLTKRAETQSKQYDSLLQKLNEVANDAKESRELAEMERERAAQLQTLLEQSISNKTVNNVDTATDPLETYNHVANKSETKKKFETKHSPYKANKLADRHSLENLHRKAQELLNIASMSSSSSDISSSEKSTPLQTKPVEIQDLSIKKSKMPNRNKTDIKQTSNSLQHSKKNIAHETREQKFKKEKPKSHAKIEKEETYPVVPGSPMKLVRAKLTEEVNNRLVSAGVDPLKSRLPKYIFQKQRMQLQQQLELKSKKNSAHEKARHAILTFLDSSTTDLKKEVTQTNDFISPSKVNKTFRSLTSVISGVKSKALSLVKLNEKNVKNKRKSLNAEVAKRTMSSNKTPPGSATSSPEIKRHSPAKVNKESAQEPHIKVKPNESKVLRNKTKNSYTANTAQVLQANAVNNYDSDSSDESSASNHKYTAIVQQASKSIESLIKSPARRPSSAIDYKQNIGKYTIDNGEVLVRTQSATDLTGVKAKANEITKTIQMMKIDNSSDDVESLTDISLKKATSVENIQTTKQTKSVLKNASSTTSLNKKKVLFDMDAIQMKSLSASPSQSITEKSDGNEKYELGLVNLDGEEWDISSIENEPLKNDTKIQLNTRTSPKIAELKQTIEAQLSRRNETPSARLVGGVDVFGIGRVMTRAASTGGSNTSLGSSILDESETAPTTNHRAFVKPKRVTEKEDSELDISEFSIDGPVNKNESF